MVEGQKMSGGNVDGAFLGIELPGCYSFLIFPDLIFIKEKVI